MTRQLFLGTLAALTLAVLPTAVLAEEGFGEDHIIISAPREKFIGLVPGTHAPVVLYTVSVRVNIGDLDIRTQPGWLTMTQRVDSASRRACEVLDRQIPVSAMADKCRSDATKNVIKVANRLRTAPTHPTALTFAVGGN